MATPEPPSVAVEGLSRSVGGHPSPMDLADGPPAEHTHQRVYPIHLSSQLVAATVVIRPDLCHWQVEGGTPAR